MRALFSLCIQNTFPFSPLRLLPLPAISAQARPEPQHSALVIHRRMHYITLLHIFCWPCLHTRYVFHLGTFTIQYGPFACWPHPTMSRMTQPPRPQHLPSTCSCCNNKSHGQHPHPAGSCVAPNRGRIDPYLSHNMDTQTRSSQVLRIYWPTDLYSILSKSRFSPSVIVGWRNSDNDLVVVTTLPYLNLSIVSDLLAKDVLLMKYSIPHRQIYSVCGRDKLSLLGTVNCTSDRCDEIPRGRAPFIPHKSFFNFKYTKSMKYPEIDHSPSTGSHRMLGSILSSAQVFPYSFAQVILFDPLSAAAFSTLP